MGVAESVEFRAEGNPLGVILIAEGFLFRQVHFCGQHVEVAFMGDARGYHRVKFQSALFLVGAAGCRVQLHGDQVLDRNAGIPLVAGSESVGGAHVQVEPALVGLVFVAVELVVFKPGDGFGVLEGAQLNVFWRYAELQP